MSNQNRRFKVAIVGATGAVGETMLNILAERQFPVSELIALASERSAGGTVDFGGQKIDVQDLATFDPTGVDIALFSAGGSVSKEYGPKFAAAGAVVIDNSSAFRYDDDVPLVVSEVNPEQVQNRPRGIIANPNCSTMQMLVALAPIHRAVGIERINVATYQSVSGTGRNAIEEAAVRAVRLACVPRDRLQILHRDGRRAAGEADAGEALQGAGALMPRERLRRAVCAPLRVSRHHPGPRRRARRHARRHRAPDDLGRLHEVLVVAERERASGDPQPPVDHRQEQLAEDSQQRDGPHRRGHAPGPGAAPTSGCCACPRRRGR